MSIQISCLGTLLYSVCIWMIVPFAVIKGFLKNLYIFFLKLIPYLNWFPPQNEEVLSSHHHEPHEFVAKNLLDFISLQLSRIAFRFKKIVVLKKTTTSNCVKMTCLTAMLTLTELMDPSMRTFSLSLRLITTGWRSSSLLLL